MQSVLIPDVAQSKLSFIINSKLKLHTKLCKILLAYNFLYITITPAVSNFERVHIDDYSCTRSTNMVIFTWGPEPSLGNGLPGVPLPLVCGFHAADPGPSIHGQHVKKHVTCVDGVDKAVVIRLVSDDG